MSLRAMQGDLGGKLSGLWKLCGMKGIDGVMKKTVPAWWYNWKKRHLYENAQKELEKGLNN